MRISELREVTSRWPLKMEGAEVPHMTLEVTQECNIRCLHCYNVDRQNRKSVEQICSEVDVGLRHRRLQSISLIGGEPTLHPELPRIIRHIRRRGLRCSLLTNGIVFLEPEGPELLRTLMEAGLDRVFLHIDEGQRHIHEDIDEVRHSLFELFEKRELHFALACTIGAGDEASVADLPGEFGRYRFFEGVLVTMAMDPEPLWERPLPAEGRPNLSDLNEAMLSELGVPSAGFIPSSSDDEFASWLMYHFFLDLSTGRTFPVSPFFNHLYRRVHRLLRGRYPFALMLDPEKVRFNFLGTAVAESLWKPGRALEALRFWQGTSLADLRYQFVVAQQPPQFNEATGRFQVCHHCPDATVRNGKLVPICLADHIEPLSDTGRAPTSPEPIRTELLEHLGGAPEEARTKMDFPLPELYRLPWTTTDNPIGWLEVTDTCNMTCRGCYRSQMTGHRPLEELKHEISLFREKRNCDNISLAGGEPTCHPEIEKIIAHVKSLEMKAVLVSNGLNLDYDRLSRLRDAGLTHLGLHIDMFQDRPGWKGKDELELLDLRDEYLDLTQRVGGLVCNIGMTVYDDNLPFVPDLVRWAEQRIGTLHGMVFVPYGAVPLSETYRYVVNGKDVPAEELGYGDAEPGFVTREQLMEAIRSADPNYHPHSYLNGTQDLEEPRWLISTRVGVPGRSYGYVGPRLMELDQAGNHLRRGRYVAYARKSRHAASIMALGLVDPVLRPGLKRYLRDAIRRPWRALDGVYAQSLTIAQAPKLSAEGEADMCDGCPDMTFWEGKLVHSCRLDEYRKFGGLLKIVPKQADCASPECSGDHAGPRKEKV